MEVNGHGLDPLVSASCYGTHSVYYSIPLATNLQRSKAFNARSGMNQGMVVYQTKSDIGAVVEAKTM
jgi:hypothetical protein